MELEARERLLAVCGEEDGDDGAAGLATDTARRFDLLPGEPLWVARPGTLDERILLDTWRRDPRLGPDGCRLAPGVLERLDLAPGDSLVLGSARSPQPDFHVFCWSQVQPSDAPWPRDVVLMLDVSASMEGYPLAQARRALTLFLERQHERRPDDRFGLVTFGHLWKRPVELVRSPAAHHLEALYTELAHVGGGGMTPLGHGLETCAELFDALLAPGATEDPASTGDDPAALAGSARSTDPTDGRSGVLVLVSDGHPTDDSEIREAAVERLLARRVRIATIGVGTDFDRHLLGTLAAASGGPFIEASRARELPVLLEEIG